MKNSSLMVATTILVICVRYAFNVNAAEDVVKIEIPASAVQSIDVNYEKSNRKVKTKNSDDENKFVESVKGGYNKTVKATKKFWNKTADSTKSGYNKTVTGTKEAINNLNPNKILTEEELTKDAQIKRLKNERNQYKSAFNSRIKDLKAKKKLLQNSTTVSTAEKQEKIYNLEKQIKELELQRDSAVYNYNLKIKQAKAN